MVQTFFSKQNTHAESNTSKNPSTRRNKKQNFMGYTQSHTVECENRKDDTGMQLKS